MYDKTWELNFYYIDPLNPVFSDILGLTVKACERFGIFFLTFFNIIASEYSDLEKDTL